MASAMSQAMAKSPKESPLASLVRRASSRRFRAPAPLDTSKIQQTPTITFQYDDDPQHQYSSGSDLHALHSPLLHGHFARDSVATASSYERNSYLESASPNSTRAHSFSSSNAYSELDYRYHYDNPYEHSQPDMNPSLSRDSWSSTTTTGMVKPIDGHGRTQPWPDLQQQYPSPHSPLVPEVVVSVPETTNHGQAGRTPIVKPGSSNFSRPVRPPPPPIDGGEEQKRQVLLRNSNRQLSESPAAQRQASGLRYEVGNRGGQSSQKQGLSQPPGEPVFSSQSSSSGVRRAASSSLSPRPTPQPPNLAPRTDSSLSAYSNYSYYPYETLVPSPTGSAFSNSNDPFAAQQRDPSSGGKPKTPPSSLTVSAAQKQTSSKPQTAHDFLLQGIEHHEADRLNESARCFERSAVEGGGCGVGMLMWGLTLRHGWGCPKNEKLAFKWLQKAAESAVGDLEATRAKGIKDTNVVRTELILAIYEVGQSFFQGWGVPKDQKMAFSYYRIASELGDPDAQMDLAFCLTNGKGCRKDKREAAKWYRAAIKQGQSDVGLAWIYKDKYQ